MDLHYVPLDAFTALCLERANIATALLWFAAREAAIYAEHVIDTGRREPLERLAHFLLEMLTRLQAVGCASENSFEMPLSQEGIGDVVGLSAPHVNRMLAELKSEGLIAMNKHEVKIWTWRRCKFLGNFTLATLCVPQFAVRDAEFLIGHPAFSGRSEGRRVIKLSLPSLHANRATRGAIIMARGRPRVRKSSSAAAPSPARIATARLTYATASRVIDIIRQPLVILDDTLRIVFPNIAFCRAFAISRDEVIGQSLTTIGDRRLGAAGFRDFLDLIQANNTIEDYEVEVEIPELGSRVLLLSAQQIANEPTAPRETLVAIDDVTERRHAEMALIAAKWHSDRANLGKSRILAAASHDLRQPLQTLNLMRAALAKKIKDKEGLKLIAQLNKTSDVMLSMLDTLLEINQLEAGIVDPEEVEFPINDLLERLRIEFAYHAEARGLRWHVVPCRLGVWSDPRLLEQMLRNLVSNAVKYTERGKILLGCRRRGDKLRIEVWDTGIGIPDEQLRAIFAEFHQPGNPTHNPTLGFGLGLPIVQRLAHVLGHVVEVHSRPGKGSVFAVEVPLGEGQQERRPPAVIGMQNRRPPTTPRRGRPRRHWMIRKAVRCRPTIFVVDDEGACGRRCANYSNRRGGQSKHTQAARHSSRPIILAGKVVSSSTPGCQG